MSSGRIEPTCVNEAAVMFMMMVQYGHSPTVRQSCFPADAIQSICAQIYHTSLQRADLSWMWKLILQL
jgi:hypothetical protein